MAKVTSTQFVELAQKSQLADLAAIDDFVAKLKAEHHGKLPADPVEVAKAFEKAELLTRWHCEKMLQGKYRGFFLGKHKLLGHLGTGGMSTVYLAEHVMMRSKRAIKVLPKSKLGNNSYLMRFQQEAKAIASLNHPNIVRAFDIDNENDTHYIVMEYVDGADIQSLVKKNGPLSYERVAEYTAQAAAGLQHAHDKGLIHRDVKPANLLVNREGMVKVLDLGLALFADEEQSSLTMEHNDKVLGTADYLAPEQAINSHKIDYRADIYSLGCSMYYMLTGRPPFPEGSIAQRIAKHQKIMPDDIRKFRPDCPGELDGICVKMMQKDPRYRYATCRQVAEALQSWLEVYRQNAVPAKSSLSANATGGGIAVLTKSGDSSNSFAKPGGSSGHNLAAGSSGKIAPITNLSASDSGILRKIAETSGSFITSKIDLEKDTNAPLSHSRKQPTSTDLAKEQQRSLERISQIAKSNAKRVQNAPTSPTNPSAPKPGPIAGKQPSASNNSKGASKTLLVLGALFMLIVAVLTGFFIAKWVG